MTQDPPQLLAPVWKCGKNADRKKQTAIESAVRRDQILCFNARPGGCTVRASFIEYAQLATFGFVQKTDFNGRTDRRIIKVRPRI